MCGRVSRAVQESGQRDRRPDRQEKLLRVLEIPRMRTGRIGRQCRLREHSVRLFDSDGGLAGIGQRVRQIPESDQMLT